MTNHTPQIIWSRCTCTFGRFACLRSGLLFAPSVPQQHVLDPASRSGHRRSLRTKELHVAWRCTLGTEAPRGEEDRKILFHAATHGVTGTYAEAAQSINVRKPGDQRRGRECGWRRSTRTRLQYLSAPESGGGQPRIHRDLYDPMLLDPQTRWIAGELLKHTVREGTVASYFDLTQAP